MFHVPTRSGTTSPAAASDDSGLVRGRPRLGAPAPRSSAMQTAAIAPAAHRAPLLSTIASPRWTHIIAYQAAQCGPALMVSKFVLKAS
ncbi:hypothetical protein Slala03_74060 [Streptomyces lavendulae subsp. lavendulae]|nr:hypothetical protein Slala03_74060 [Streptomyces lavendulae subsp. lavendulae]